MTKPIPRLAIAITLGSCIFSACNQQPAPPPPIENKKVQSLSQNQETLALVRSKLGNPDVLLEETGFPTPLEESIQLGKLAQQAAQQNTNPEIQGELELAHLRAMSMALQQATENNAVMQTLLSHLTGMVIREPISKLWIIRPELYWQLADRYQTYLIGESIAWQAANQGQITCSKDTITCIAEGSQATYGKYLSMYPQGKHVPIALDKILGVLQIIEDDWSSYQKADRVINFAQWEKLLRPIPTSPMLEAVKTQLTQLKNKG